MKKNLILVLVCLTTVAAFGEQTFSTNVTVNKVVPDGTANGLASGIVVGGLGGAIDKVTVTLDITGGFNGDLYAYLVGPNGGFAVLLNRVGVSGTSTFGYGDAGFNITLDDTAANGDIHYYHTVLNPGVSQLTGTWQPDGANINPQSPSGAFLTAGQTAMLSSFVGTDGNGQWELFVADLSPSGQSTLVGFGFTIMAVPEPSTWVLLGSGMAVLWLCRNRRFVRS